VSEQPQARRDFQILDVNRRMIYRAYEDGFGNTLELEAGDQDNWFIGKYDGDIIMEGTEVDGILYSVFAQSGGRGVAVLVGVELVDNSAGVTFKSTAEARAYVQGLTAK
jgi:hypothetical protein